MKRNLLFAGLAIVLAITTSSYKKLVNLDWYLKSDISSQVYTNVREQSVDIATRITHLQTADPSSTYAQSGTTSEEFEFGYSFTPSMGNDDPDDVIYKQ